MFVLQVIVFQLALSEWNSPFKWESLESKLIIIEYFWACPVYILQHENIDFVVREGGSPQRCSYLTLSCIGAPEVWFGLYEDWHFRLCLFALPPVPPNISLQWRRRKGGSCDFLRSNQTYEVSEKDKKWPNLYLKGPTGQVRSALEW